MKVWSWRQAIQKSSLQSTTRLVLLNLSIYMNDIGDGCYPSTKQQAIDTGLSERALCQHLQIAEEMGFLKKQRHGFSGRGWNRQEYIACYPEGTDAGSAPKEEKALTQSQHVSKKGTDPKSARQDTKALTQDQCENLRGTDFDDIKALTLTTKGTDPKSARIYNSPKNSPKNSPIAAAQLCAREKNAIGIIQIFDESIVKVFGEEFRRPFPNGEDRIYAEKFTEYGLAENDLEGIFIHRQAANREQKKKPINNLKYFRDVLPEFVKQREINHEKNIGNHQLAGVPATEVPGGRNGSRTARKSSAEIMRDTEQDFINRLTIR